MKNLILFLLLISSSLYSTAQTIEKTEPDYIKTIEIKRQGSRESDYIFELGTKFTLSFDDLEADLKYYYYQITMCDFDWKPMNISDREYIRGYSNDRIRNEENSFNTYQFYTHYSVDFPNRQTQILRTGNYIISITDRDKNVIFTRRVILYEQRVSIEMIAKRSRNIQDRNKRQNIQFTIRHPDFVVNDPKTEIRTVLLQNDNFDFSINNLVPQYFRANELIYKYLDETDFFGGNEFRMFDSKSMRAANVNIKKVEQGPDVFHTFLYTDTGRANKPYSTFEDVNGDFVIRTVDIDGNADLNADYTWVFFSMLPSSDLGNSKVYVNGKFNNYENNYLNEMRYNEKNGKYYAEILLKQGFYNYQYVTIDENNNISRHQIDGSHMETENEYTLLVYYLRKGDRYQHVIGYQKIKTLNLQN